MTHSKFVVLSIWTIVSSLWFYPVSAQDAGPLERAARQNQNNANPSCGFDGAFDRSMAAPAFQNRQEAIEELLYRQARERLRQSSEGRSAAEDEILTIPLVIHIVHLSSEPNPGDGPSNPTDEQILAGIEHLNEAFRNSGVYAENGRQDHPALQSVNAGIEFCLAQRDINGEPSTGILRYANDNYSKLDMEVDDPGMQEWVADRNENAYPGTDYANVWLVDEICSSGSNSCSVAGYAYFPGNHGHVSNGVINRARYWGSSADNSKVHIHEFGHYLNLYHTFQGGCTNGDCLTDGDRVCDTPPDSSTSYNNCGAEENSCTTDAAAADSPFQTDVGDLYENYMDYSDNRCQNTFTQGQKERIRTALLGARSSLLQSSACIPVDAAEAGLVRISYPGESVCSNNFRPIVEVSSNGNQIITELQLSISIDGFSLPGFSWTGTIPPGATAEIMLNPVNFSGTGMHQLTVQILSSNGAPDPFANNNTQSRDFKYAAPLDLLPFCDQLESGRLNQDWVIHNPDNHVGFEVYELSNCSNQGNHVLGLQTWGAFPSTATVDAILTQGIDLSQATEATFSFDVAYATYYSNFNTILEVAVSTDCGINYTKLYRKTGTDLATAQRVANSASDPGAFFTPASCAEWRSEEVSLQDYLGQEILIRIQAGTEDLTNSSFGYYWGNNLYLDNFCVLGTTDTNGGGDTGGEENGPCSLDELELLNGNIDAGTYDDARVIYAGEPLSANADVLLKAAETVVLLPGFQAQRNNDFRAKIGPCLPESALPEAEPAALALMPDNESRKSGTSGPVLSVAPNPFREQTNVRVQIDVDGGAGQLRIIDLNGQILRVFPVHPENGSLQMIRFERDRLISGMYILLLQQGSQYRYAKLMVID